MSAEARLKELGIVLPNVPAPVANYVPFRLAGNLLFLSGQGPRGPNGEALTGKVGAEVTIEEAYPRAPPPRAAPPPGPPQARCAPPPRVAGPRSAGVVSAGP